MSETFGNDLYRRSQSRRKMAFEYLAWAKEDLKRGKLERCAENANHFHSLMYGARMDLYHLRVWGYYHAPERVEHRRAA